MQDYSRLRQQMKQEALQTYKDKDDLQHKFQHTRIEQTDAASAMVKATCRLLSSTATADEGAGVVDTVLNMASNLDNRAGLVEAGAIPMLVKLRRTGNAEEKDAACKPRSPPTCLLIWPSNLSEGLNTCLNMCLTICLKQSST